MKVFRADIHIHTVLSPCGDLEMSPDNIINKAKEKKLDIIGITDHNSLRQCSVINNMAKKIGIYTLNGVEITTKEEVHCLAFFDKNIELLEFQKYIDKYLPDIKNNPKFFGYQAVVDENNNIIEIVDKLLISAIDQSIDEIEKKVHALNGIFIPAHINKSKFSIISQLGFVPKNLNVDALEISKFITKNNFIKKYNYLKDYSFVQNSDSHYIDNIADVVTIFKMKEITFDEIKKALHNIDGRGVIVN